MEKKVGPLKNSSVVRNPLENDFPGFQNCACPAHPSVLDDGDNIHHFHHPSAGGRDPSVCGHGDPHHANGRCQHHSNHWSSAGVCQGIRDRSSNGPCCCAHRKSRIAASPMCRACIMVTPACVDIVVECRLFHFCNLYFSLISNLCFLAGILCDWLFNGLVLLVLLRRIC